MALRDYILCKNCNCKLIPDGNGLVREHLEEKWGNPEANYYTPMLLCPDCVAALEQKVEMLKKDVERLMPALEEAITSLEIISQQAGESRGLSTFAQIKQYALNWVRIVRKDLPAKYGCHCDLEEGMEPDDCVIDSGQINDCVYAQIGIKENSKFRKEDCEYWQPINIKALVTEEDQ